MTRTPRQLVVACMLVASALALGAGPAFAGAADRYREQIQTFRAQLAEQAEADEAGLAAQDINKLADWLDEAESLLEQGETDEAGYRLKRVEYGLELVRALTAASQIQAQAENQELAATEARAQVTELEQQVTELKARKAELEQQLRQLR